MWGARLCAGKPWARVVQQRVRKLRAAASLHVPAAAGCVPTITVIADASGILGTPFTAVTFTVAASDASCKAVTTGTPSLTSLGSWCW